jgi:endonuclease YncB( thermonuclease family)
MEGLVKLAKVVDVYDGDSLKVNLFMHGQLIKVALRLEGFDTAEMKSKVPEVKAFAEYTRDIVRKMLLGKVVKVLLGKSEKYGRTLARLMIRVDAKKEFCFNDWMIQQGLALGYRGATKREITAELVANTLNQKVQLVDVVDYA